MGMSGDAWNAHWGGGTARAYNELGIQGDKTLGVLWKYTKCCGNILRVLEMFWVLKIASLWSRFSHRQSRLLGTRIDSAFQNELQRGMRIDSGKTRVDSPELRFLTKCF
ncbi:hypothetical protein PIB30_093915 [Stylosanthes scabra]|uniref:Uncharacterized protein n=1 Tax=Stylosanthes scabra TaxID=79078 RepID=A0ABU6YVU6_9FABA|nr:hypothetical protein [Stylosanthes scabra]